MSEGSSREPGSVVRVGRCERAFSDSPPAEGGRRIGVGAAQSCRPPRKLLCSRASHVSLVSDGSGISRIKPLIEQQPVGATLRARLLSRSSLPDRTPQQAEHSRSRGALRRTYPRHELLEEPQRVAHLETASHLGRQVLYERRVVPVKRVCQVVGRERQDVGGVLVRPDVRSAHVGH